MKKKLSANAQCSSCGGTGVYVGMAERDGAGVICRTCNGTGCEHIHITYTLFTKRQRTKKVKRVYENSCGICIGVGYTKESGRFNLESFGGLPYKDWWNGKKFTKETQMRRFTCPAQWFQNTDYAKKPDHWKECLGCGSFSDCDHFKDKDKCWVKHDKEYGRKHE